MKSRVNGLNASLPRHSDPEKLSKWTSFTWPVLKKMKDKVAKVQFSARRAWACKACHHCFQKMKAAEAHLCGKRRADVVRSVKALQDHKKRAIIMLEQRHPAMAGFQKDQVGKLFDVAIEFVQRADVSKQSS